jgi:hypothetical protein
MKKITSIFLLTLGLLSVSSCNEFDELNVDPVNPTAVSPELLFTGALRNGTLNWDVYQIGQNLHADLFVQYFANVNPGFQTDQYNSNPAWAATFWNTYFSNYIINTQEVIRLTQADPAQSNKTNVARIWRAWLFHRATDYWGDIPYSEAGQAFGGNRTPKYDAQEAIYKDMIKELKEAAQALDNSNAQKFTANDLLYKGDLDKWKKFANSLRLRLGMRLSKADPAFARTVVSEVMTENNLIASNADNALMGTQPTGQFINRYPLAILFNFDELRVSKTMVDLLKNLNDPRLAVYAQPVENVTPPTYVGLLNGLSAQQLAQPQNAKALYSKMGTAIRAEGTPIDILTYPEVSFLKAEAVQRGWATGNAATFYQQGIRASMAKRAVTNTAAIDTYLAQPSVAYNNTVERIITQKYLALFPDGFEAWAEWRRTGFPTLLQIPNQGETNGTVPRRVIYPQSEASLNAAAYEAAIATQGPNTMTTRVWWDKP